MIQPNAKIEKFNGIRFYEQDIMFDDFVYEDYAELTLNIDYVMPGFGIVLINSTSSILTDECECFLFRIGYREASIEYKSGSIFQTILTIPTEIIPSINNGMKVRFEKSGKEVRFEINGEIVFGPRHYKFPKTISKFCLGIYSNAGNMIHTVSSSSKIPDFWNINMYNTIGGRIKFYDSGFTITECKEYAEIEQYDIYLTAGTYYLKYTMSEDSDINCYVFESDDLSIVDAEKNLLDKDNKFTLEKDCRVNLKFTGKYGSVSNIILNTDPYSKYVSTIDDNTFVPGSKVIVNKTNLDKINWSGTISSIFSDVESFILCDNEFIFVPSVIKMNQEYHYEYHIEERTLSIRDSYNELIYLYSIYESDDEAVTIFNNVDAEITDFSITKTNGDTINYITSDTETRSVSINRNAPLIITDESGEPLDISSSYRIYTTFNEDNSINYDLDRIVFTNIEREVFEPQIILRTASNINGKLNSVRIFGIREEIDYDYIYRVIRNENDVGLCCNYNYEVIDGDKYTISSNNSEIHLSGVDTDEYKYFIVDYLKDNSYSINPNFENNTYEIDISTNKTVMYYFDVDHSLLSDYMIIPFNSFETTNDSYYLCIRNDTSVNPDTSEVSVT